MKRFPSHVLPGIVLSAALLGAVPQYAGSAEPAPNLLRNGSFEGGLLYWHNLEPDLHRLVRGDAAVGEYSLEIRSKNVMSAPFACEPGAEFTVSFFAKGERDGEIRVQLPPSAREPGQAARRLWVGEATQSAPIGPQWRRISFSARADVPQTGFWPYPHYLVQFEGTVPLQIDGVTITLGNAPAPEYIPRREVEVVAECPDLPGYADHGNILPRDAVIRVVAHVSNPGDGARSVVVRRQFVDYEGILPLGEPEDRAVSVPPGKTVTETFRGGLPASGCVLARVSVLEDGREIDRSELPLTSLPYPFAPRPPDPRERFGGSFFGPGSALQGSRIGFAWSRWFPHTKWQDHQPDGPDSWRWFDPELDTLEGLGISTHLVLYGWPKWAMDDTHPLPKDMRWSPDDPRWEDLTPVSSWDRYVTGVAEHYRDRAVVYEIENEPEFDRWDNYRDEYALFTVRTARLIKGVNPAARVMVNNTYGIPSGLNRHFLERGGAKVVDIVSWHDYHEGWLSDAMGIRRMRANLDALGGEHIEIWFNEGWAYTNTAVDEPIACTRLTSAQSTNAILASVAEMTVAGQEKTVLFHTGYEKHGMSFWDYSGPGTMLWDWYGYPLPLVAGWNTLAHHVGLSDRVALVRPEGANFCIFEDLRNRRGVMVAYADREAPGDVSVELPAEGLIVEDLMGNARPLGGRRLVLPRSGRPVFLYDDARTPGKTFAALLEPLDRKHASFVSSGGGVFRLPPAWDGSANGSSEGNPVLADGKPVWRLDQVWPPDPSNPAHYRPLVRRDGWWVPKADSFGDQPKAEMKDRGIRLEFRAAHGEPPAERICGLVFLVPADGTYSVSGSAEMRLWEGGNPVRLTLLRKGDTGVEELAAVDLEPGRRIEPGFAPVSARAGEEFVILPRISGAYSGGEVVLRDVVIASDAGAGPAWSLPRAWEGGRTGTPEGNPIEADGRPVWRLDQLWPDDPIMASNYRPLVWLGGNWGVTEHGQGGHPSASVKDGVAILGGLGPWNGPDVRHRKTAALVFVPPRDGVYRVEGTARCQPWEGNAATFPFAILKKDTQRVAEIASVELPRDNSPVVFRAEAELSAGHELLLMPMMPHWHNAASTRIEGLKISPVTAETDGARRKP